MAATSSSQDLAHEDLDYIRQKTDLNTDRIFDFYKTFLSKYNNGYVSRDEFSEIMTRLIVDDKSSQEHADPEKLKMCEILFDICDKDDNGFIDFKEYLVLFWSRANGTPTQKLSLIFDIFDLNGNNAIDFHEMHSIVKILFKLKYSNIDAQASLAAQTLTSPTQSDEHDTDGNHLNNYFIFNSNLPPTYHIAMNIMKKFDENRNATLSKEEFINGCLQHPNIKQFLTPLKVL